MRLIHKVTLGILINVIAVNVSTAREDIGEYSIASAMAREVFKSELGDNIKFYFGKQKHPKVVSEYVRAGTSKKTNAFNKSDEEACQWAFLSAMKSLRDRAMKEGGNAVINITSNYKNNETSSESNFKCGAGNIMAGVALKGTVVKLNR
jgi:uncharacterized protein YbjQ (UPF0145 family)